MFAFRSSLQCQRSFLRVYSTTAQAARPSRLQKYARRLAYSTAGVGALYTWDRHYNASAIFRNIRTLYTCALITADYKINFTPGNSDGIPALQERVAQRVYDLLVGNGGLYIKIGQAIGANAAVLPKPMQLKFASLFDDAPQIPYSVVEKVFVSELGRPPSGPGGVFEFFDENAVASASIAQVHKAKTWPTVLADGTVKEGEWVAVKVQKPDVAKQMEWDLGAYRFVMWAFENWAFDLPVYFVVDFISDHLRQELDFVREANNALQTAEFIAQEPSLRDKVHIPKVYSEYSTQRVLVAEWIDGVRLSDKSGIYRLMGQRESSPSLGSSATPDALSATALVASAPNTTTPTTSVSTFQYPAKPLKGGVKAVMQTMVELFSAQMFSWGWVHCDPHPGNVIIRPSPTRPGHPQLVLIDHGLYVRVPEEFKTQWVHLWRSMLAGDREGVQEVASSWGMGMPDILASFTLMKPVSLRSRKSKKRAEGEVERPRRKLTQYEASVLMKKALKDFLVDTDRMPKVLIFLTRNMRMVQGNNQSFGSPVNRIKITANWASRSLYSNASLTPKQRVKEWYRHVVYTLIMFTLDVAFWRNKVVQWYYRVKERVLGTGARRDVGFEEEMERNMRDFAKDNLGFEVPETVFSG